MKKLPFINLKKTLPPNMTGYIFNLVVHIDLSLAFSLVLTISKASMKFPNASVLNVILC